MAFTLWHVHATEIARARLEVLSSWIASVSSFLSRLHEIRHLEQTRRCAMQVTENCPEATQNKLETDFDFSALFWVRYYLHLKYGIFAEERSLSFATHQNVQHTTVEIQSLSVRCLST